MSHPVNPRATKEKIKKRAEGPNSFNGGTPYQAQAWGRGSNIEFGVAGTKQLILKYEELVELLLQF